MIIVSQFHPHKLKIDGELVELRIKRMNAEEHSEFSARAVKTGSPTWARFVSRATSGPEQEKDEKGKYKISLEALASQKVEAFTQEQRLELEAATAEDEVEAQGFLKWAFSSFVRVKSGLLEENEAGDQVAVKEGIDLLRIFGARNDVITEVLAAISLENELNSDEKKDWKLRIDSLVSSSAPGPDLVGPKPEMIVSNAETEASVAIEVAKPEDKFEPPETKPEAGGALSGSTGTSPSNIARSSR